MLCLCGCGQEAGVAKQTDARWGHVKGEPLKYLAGHRFKTSTENKTDSQKAVESRARKMERLKRERGGACERCGYARCLRALDWHHVDPATKSFTIGSHPSYSYARLKEETEKCELWCANCHREEQDGL